MKIECRDIAFWQKDKRTLGRIRGSEETPEDLEANAAVQVWCGRVSVPQGPIISLEAKWEKAGLRQAAQMDLSRCPFRWAKECYDNGTNGSTSASVMKKNELWIRPQLGWLSRTLYCVTAGNFKGSPAVWFHLHRHTSEVVWVQFRATAVKQVSQDSESWSLCWWRGLSSICKAQHLWGALKRSLLYEACLYTCLKIKLWDGDHIRGHQGLGMERIWGVDVTLKGLEERDLYS